MDEVNCCFISSLLAALHWACFDARSLETAEIIFHPNSPDHLTAAEKKVSNSCYIRVYLNAQFSKQISSFRPLSFSAVSKLRASKQAYCNDNKDDMKQQLTSPISLRPTPGITTHASWPMYIVHVFILSIM